MKPSTTLLFLILFFLASEATPPQPLGLIRADPKNVLKINLVPLLFKTYSIQYERTIFRNFSIGVQGGYNSELRLGTYINKVLDTVSNARLMAVRAKVTMTELSTSGNVYFTPEIRLYLSRKGAPNGFYIAPYLRFSTTNVNSTLIYKDSNNNNIPILFTGRMTSIHPGVLLGYQKSILKRLVVDFWLGGIQFGSSKATFDAEADFKKLDQQGFIDFVHDNFKYGSSTLTIANDAHAQMQYTGKSSGFRIGLCVGFRF